MLIIKQAICIIIGFASGLIISGAVFAFIAAIGVVTRLAQKTGTSKYIMIYEEAITFGGIFGALTDIIDFHIPIGKPFAIFICFCLGTFFGCLAMSLAEVLDAIPILLRRVRIKQGMFFFILAIAVGKLIGSLLYFIIPGFYIAQ